MVGAATVFVVANIAKSTEHYRDVLGFTVTFEWGDPTSLHLNKKVRYPPRQQQKGKRSSV
jgi:catechol 2,3-dioxygenase-like lactoylglutathione lyase family enzyme